MSRRDDRVKVAVRVRPFTAQEAGNICCVDMKDNALLLRNATEERRFDFDYCFWSHDEFVQEKGTGLFAKDSENSRYCDQYDLYDALGEELLENAFEGYNACIFAYGYTGSGKSYSVVGSGPNPGLMPLLCERLFEKIGEKKETGRKFVVEVSIFELYNEGIYDLLSSARVNEVRATSGPYLLGVSSRKTSSLDEIESVLEQGMKRRTMAATTQNDNSSRSHTVYRINLRQVTYDLETEEVLKEISSDINLVDLAGAERVGAVGVVGDRFDEGLSINKSLLTLERVINALVEKRAHIPYRESKLTFILQNALGGNSRTAMLATISPSLTQYQETLSTLQYAQNAKKIENSAVVNFRAPGTELARLRLEVDTLRRSLQESEKQRGLQQQELERLRRLRKSACCAMF